MSLIAASTPPVTKEFFEKLQQAFTSKLDITPNVTTMEEIMFHAGTQAVVEWIRHFTRDQIVTGKADVSQTVNMRSR